MTTNKNTDDLVECCDDNLFELPGTISSCCIAKTIEDLALQKLLKTQTLIYLFLVAKEKHYIT